MDYTQTRESGFRLENATKFQIQDKFENGKPDIVLKTVKRFNLKRKFKIGNYRPRHV